MVRWLPVRSWPSPGSSQGISRFWTMRLPQMVVRVGQVPERVGARSPVVVAHDDDVIGR